jgi:hypothetical protein
VLRFGLYPNKIRYNAFDWLYQVVRDTSAPESMLRQHFLRCFAELVMEIPAP